MSQLQLSTMWFSRGQMLVGRKTFIVERLALDKEKNIQNKVFINTRIQVEIFSIQTTSPVFSLNSCVTLYDHYFFSSNIFTFVPKMTFFLNCDLIDFLWVVTGPYLPLIDVPEIMLSVTTRLVVTHISLL